MKIRIMLLGVLAAVALCASAEAPQWVTSADVAQQRLAYEKRHV